MYSAVQKILFLFPAEAAHNLGLWGVRLIGFFYRLGLWPHQKHGTPLAPPQTVSLPVPFSSISRHVGLAAGLDKNAVALWGWEALGFGFVEVGTATPLPQPGNPKPRLFRRPEISAIVNRMGFNNDGAEKIAWRVRKAKQGGLKIPVGGNIGKNKETSLELAANDYKKAAQALAPICDYLVINVSSPNTPGLRLLQSRAALEAIVMAVKEVSSNTPLFIKVAPDDGMEQSTDIIAVIVQNNLSGVIVGNALKLPEGGLSGAPVYEKNLALARHYVEELQKKGRHLVIGVGGILSKEQAQSYFSAGCDLVQIYSGFIYKGPKLIQEII